MSDNHHIQLCKCPLGEVAHLDLLSDNLCQLYLNDEYSDISFIVEGNRLPAHRFVLAARSEYFRALLYGGMRESLPECNEIELKQAPHQAFSILLKYIYTGRMNLIALKEDIILETLGLANQYGFVNLESSISDYLKAILTVKNVCMIFDMANLYRLSSLRNTCFQFMDRNSAEIIDNRIYLSLSASAMHDMIRRDSFCAKEVDIFKAVHEWSQANPSLDPTEILTAVRFPLMTLQEIMDIVRPTMLIPPDQLLDAIRDKLEKRNCELNYRGFLAPEENIATFRHGAHVILGEKRAALLDGDTANYDLDRGFTRHPIEDPVATNVCTNINGPSGIVIKLGTQCIINHIKMLLWDKDLRSYSYYIETSVDQTDWVRVVDHSKYLCRSWQNLYFPFRVARYIKIIGTHNTVNRVFHVVHLEAMYTCKPYKLVDGLICPNENVSSLNSSACVIEGVSRSRNALINGDYKNYDWDSGYTCHQIGSGCIIIQLAQPYIISSFRMLLWDCDDRFYKYTIKTSIDQVSWELAVDKTNESCKSWQNLTFTPRPVIFVKIEGTQNTANEVFHCVHFECPNTLILESPSSGAAAASIIGSTTPLSPYSASSPLVLVPGNGSVNVTSSDLTNDAPLIQTPNHDISFEIAATASTMPSTSGRVRNNQHVSCFQNASQFYPAPQTPNCSVDIQLIGSMSVEEVEDRSITTTSTSPSNNETGIRNTTSHVEAMEGDGPECYDQSVIASSSCSTSTTTSDLEPLRHYPTSHFYPTLTNLTYLRESNNQNDDIVIANQLLNIISPNYFTSAAKLIREANSNTVDMPPHSEMFSLTNKPTLHQNYKNNSKNGPSPFSSSSSTSTLNYHHQTLAPSGSCSTTHDDCNFTKSIAESSLDFERNAHQNGTNGLPSLKWDRKHVDNIWPAQQRPSSSCDMMTSSSFDGVNFPNLFTKPMETTSPLHFSTGPQPALDCGSQYRPQPLIEKRENSGPFTSSSQTPKLCGKSGGDSSILGFLHLPTFSHSHHVSQGSNASSYYLQNPCPSSLVLATSSIFTMTTPGNTNNYQTSNCLFSQPQPTSNVGRNSLSNSPIQPFNSETFVALKNRRTCSLFSTKSGDGNNKCKKKD